MNIMNRDIERERIVNKFIENVNIAKTKSHYVSVEQEMLFVLINEILDLKEEINKLKK